MLGPVHWEVRRLWAEVRRGIAGIRRYGLLLPLFRALAHPTMIFDPVLVNQPIRRFQRLSASVCATSGNRTGTTL